ncbi:tripartite tricarboxylate transporter substrate binding protein [Achromobacter ruhlandii]|uniref:tripartite tricarboxylate transporter substrate binding protein n=1 Tax=Achromobacter ruhlandii TaxID=72557 RepID=UPI0021F138AE|nr:tripartite tricarboxylate transporter substrate binding protein [Achromobacter ruhlandii]MCV6797636.1 tripartite tricarboxylate transporter substrate binding protein [Achromobacter ruhlandii]MCV6801782.1 tripartite tricarboxylate transporter substrate binding protein [Achromobacter ruhlandii]MCV6809727.1 tripartite tricarboxylate transporter substrate binding protein [Achromobacter ruhlandii]MCV6818889.1 tripartite tricarboxylate transporter substrate binding protein [Achromobacter ruhlandii
MKKTRHTALAALRPVAAALALAGTLGAAQAADYPDQPITVVVPYSAGGGADNAARIIAQGMGEVAGQSVVIENKGGASGSIGAAYVARAKPDGYTVLYDASAFSINPVLRKLPYDAKKDFIPVSQAVSVPNILVAATGSAFNSLPDFIKAARANPGRYTYASYGPGSLAQMAAELLKKDAKIDIVHVPYKGGAPAIVDVMGGQVDVYFANAASSLNYVSTGKLKALAVSSAARMPDLPNVPTVSEGGVNAFDVVEWNGFFLPAGTDPQVVAKLQELVQKALARPETRDKLAKLGLTPVGSSAADFAKFVDAEQVRWAEVVKTNNITVN